MSPECQNTCVECQRLWLVRALRSAVDATRDVRDMMGPNEIGEPQWRANARSVLARCEAEKGEAHAYVIDDAPVTISAAIRAGALLCKDPGR